MNLSISTISGESDKQHSRSLSMHDGNIEVWEEISERTFFRNIANQFP